MIYMCTLKFNLILDNGESIRKLAKIDVPYREKG